MMVLGLAEIVSRRVARWRTACIDRRSALVRELVAVTDELGRLAGSDGGSHAARLVAVHGRVARLLPILDVLAIEDAGGVDFTRHEVVGERPTTDAALFDRIAASIRPGYLWRHEVLRPQQVIAYVPAEGS